MLHNSPIKYENNTATKKLVALFTEDFSGTKDTLIVTQASLEQVEQLLKLGANPNTSFMDAKGHHTPLLCFASQCCNTDLVNLLLTHGANPNTRDHQGRSCIGLSLSPSTISFACDETQTKQFGTYLLENAKHRLFDRVGTVDALLNHGIALKILKRTHETPVQNLLSGNLKASLIKEKYINSYVFDSSGINQNFSDPVQKQVKTLVFDSQWDVFPTKVESDKILGLLLAKGIHLNSTDSRGFTPLHYAVLKKDVPTVKILVESGADVNAKSKNGYTPIHIAAAKGSLDLTKYLIEKNADAYQKDSKGRDAIDFALSRNLYELADFIRTSAPEKVRTSCYSFISHNLKKMTPKIEKKQLNLVSM